MVLQETFTRERNERVMFARLIVNAIMCAARVMVPSHPKDRHETSIKNEAEMARLLDVYEAEAHQDLYRPDIVEAINDRLARKLKESNFAAKYDEALQAKVSAFSEDD